MNMISFAKTAQELKHQTNKKSMSFMNHTEKTRSFMMKQSTTTKTNAEAAFEAMREPTGPPLLSKQYSTSSNCSDITTKHMYNDNCSPDWIMNDDYLNDDSVASDIEIDDDSNECLEELTTDQITDRLGAATLEQDVLDSLYNDEERHNSMAWYSAKIAKKSRKCKMRKNAIQWVRATSLEFGFEPSTEFKSIYYFDKLCTIRHLRPRRCGLVAAACLWIAANFNETWENVPTLKRFSEQCGYGSNAITTSELQILRPLGFRLKVALPIDFVQYFIHQKTECVIFENDIVDNKLMSNLYKSEQIKNDLEKFSLFFLQIASQNYSFWQYSSSTVAAAAIYAARRAMQIKPYNHSGVSVIYQCGEEEIKECFDKLWRGYQRKFSKQAGLYESNQPQPLN